MKTSVLSIEEGMKTTAQSLTATVHAAHCSGKRFTLREVPVSPVSVVKDLFVAGYPTRGPRWHENQLPEQLSESKGSQIPVTGVKLFSHRQDGGAFVQEKEQSTHIVMFA